MRKKRKDKLMKNETLVRVTSIVTIVLGILGLYILNFYEITNLREYYMVWGVFGTCLVSILFGCFLWTRLKNRHWIFTLWGILAPIGLLGIALLRDKSEKT